MLLGAGGAARAQELEARAFSPNPTGANIVVLGYARSAGSIVFDASVPFRDVEARLNAMSLGYVRTFSLLGRSASGALAVPYVWGTIEGNVSETFRSITRSGLADARARLAVNLIGGPALAPREFASRRPATTLGASLTVAVPAGQYDPAKLINIGSNRWSFKPQLGLAHPLGPWNFELNAGTWMFTANDDFFGGHRRTQQPVGALEGHVARTFKPRLWLAASATFYAGGRSTLDGVRNDDLQENSRFGLTLAVPVGRRHSVKAAWASGVTTRVGGDFDAVSLAWQYLWLD